MIAAAFAFGFVLGIASVFVAAFVATREPKCDKGVVPLRWDGTRAEVDGSNVVSIFRAASVRAQREYNRPKGQPPKDSA